MVTTAAAMVLVEPTRLGISLAMFALDPLNSRCVTSELVNTGDGVHDDEFNQANTMVQPRGLPPITNGPRLNFPTF